MIRSVNCRVQYALGVVSFCLFNLDYLQANQKHNRICFLISYCTNLFVANPIDRLCFARAVRRVSTRDDELAGERDEQYLLTGESNAT
jgi:hypothetical protein